MLATEPPETNRGVRMTCWTAVACARSIRVIDPLVNPTWFEHLVGDDLEYVQQRRPDGHEIQFGMRLPVVVHGGFNRFVCMHGARTYSERAR